MRNLPAAQWVQLNVGLVRTNGSAIASARKLLAQIDPLVARWRGLGWLDCYFLMRKPPDVRLRFRTPDRAMLVHSELSVVMARLLASGEISEFFFSDYQAETNRFGGVAAMNVVHDYFDLDTQNWIALDRLVQLEPGAIDPDLLLPCLCQDLFDRVLGDNRSILKTWHDLAALTPLSEPSISLPAIELLPFVGDSLSLEHRLAASGEIAIAKSKILASYIRAHNKLGAEFNKLWQADLLTADLYEILATIALFSFNRHGFPGERSAPIVAAVILALEPIQSTTGRC